MSASDPGLRRVSVHAGNALVDLSLPAALPVATLIPSILDSLAALDIDCQPGERYHLSLPGSSALDASTTLAQNGIRDGTVMVLSQARPSLPVARCDDVAEAVSATLGAAARGSEQSQDRLTSRLMGAVAAICLTGIGAATLVRNAVGGNAARYTTAGVAVFAGFLALLFAVFAHRAHGDPMAGLTLGLIATVFAALAGFLAVPGAPGIPGVLLAAMAAAVMSVSAMRLSGCGRVTLTAVSCFAMVVAIAALAGVITTAPLHVIASVSALASLGLLEMAARVSIMLGGLSPRLPPTPGLDTPDRLAAKATRADSWLTSLLAAFSCSAALGAIVTVVTGAPRLGCVALATATGAVLLLHAHGVDRRRALIFVVGGIVTTGTTFAITAAGIPDRGPWIAAMTAMLVAAALYLGSVATVMPTSPLARRGVELMEYLAIIAMVPLTCWICGVYRAVRAINPTWS
ncbi:type VII secretion integral membrane protein EccD [Mycobacterium sp. SP-6446]|uniref:type VII secretion integral membrane protein EccD n=1 Tax=Mycobacterium sp. SP-6446 TaxID=1834162 RepID=UPI00096F0AA7|nr:type VII secretion integral membrane protein EccD [Mycobacterium sp. SP-6446]OMC09312.1 type VII secretion integral membrane protein EccD [Mycobacterium sp. SP-6446]